MNVPVTVQLLAVTGALTCTRVQATASEVEGVAAAKAALVAAAASSSWMGSAASNADSSGWGRSDSGNADKSGWAVAVPTAGPGPGRQGEGGVQALLSRAQWANLGLMDIWW